tara:strand:- start:1126 stop:2208 length:1083 start_codon:yes stop_codon:yes gene_type:complete
MKVGIIGNNLTSLVLAKALVNKEIYVDVFYKNKNINIDKTRTIGISKSNIDYFNKNILNISKILWPIKKIKIYSENSNDQEIIRFEDQVSNLFSIMKNEKIFDKLNSDLKRKKFFKLKKDIGYKNLSNSSYNLLINCDYKHELTKKLFFKKFEKKYNSIAFTTIIHHKKLKFNNTAFQVFTDKGPIAFLPISKEETSIVYSIRTKKFDTEFNIRDLIKKFNLDYEVKKIDKISKFNLSSLNLRQYYTNNILAFGDLLHKLHPLAGQGFNMSMRDIRRLLEIISEKVELGLPLDKSICVEFQNKTKSNNLIFSEGIDFIYESFNSKDKFKKNFIDLTVRMMGKNKLINRYFKKIADTGLNL